MLGSNGCKVKFKLSLNIICIVFMNRGGGLIGIDFVFKEKFKDMVILMVGLFVF